ncbi:2350_t:CDS:2, partial [Dentiscutata erythropus]
MLIQMERILGYITTRNSVQQNGNCPDGNRCCASSSDAWCCLSEYECCGSSKANGCCAQSAFPSIPPSNQPQSLCDP